MGHYFKKLALLEIIFDWIGNAKLHRLAKVISYYFDAACSLAARQDPSARLYKDT